MTTKIRSSIDIPASTDEKRDEMLRDIEKMGKRIQKNSASPIPRDVNISSSELKRLSNLPPLTKEEQYSAATQEQKVTKETLQEDKTEEKPKADKDEIFKNMLNQMQSLNNSINYLLTYSRETAENTKKVSSVLSKARTGF